MVVSQHRAETACRLLVGKHLCQTGVTRFSAHLQSPPLPPLLVGTAGFIDRSIASWALKHCGRDHVHMLHPAQDPQNTYPMQLIGALKLVEQVARTAACKSARQFISSLTLATQCWKLHHTTAASQCTPLKSQCAAGTPSLGHHKSAPCTCCNIIQSMQGGTIGQLNQQLPDLNIPQLHQHLGPLQQQFSSISVWTSAAVCGF